ncbi:Epsin related protein [Giardia duodenalis]|uniref:Epsin related protein n=1 Tax=Giardia intestinalis (strain ATCC 50803 / WB clone C6) TaxID=184922 RepID=A8BIK9_GIAIC|nr:Epsin related protein [Giardia intestinalis]KAE8305623.1 Epsin related protein [Giardia intestinalis]|eukprot:XP_001706857.1 EH domain binding protein epsin 2 [Giardia lamblia ATCC 50803]
MPAKENMQNFFGKVDRTFKRQSEEEYRVNQITSPKVSWGPSPEDMDDIVRYCEHHSARTNVMKTIWSLLSSTNSKSWKQIYKTLLLIEHLLINASPDTVRDIQSHLNVIQTLEDFRYKDEEGVDRGINVRKRAETVRELAMSDDIDDKRRNAADTRQRYADVVQNNASGIGANFSVKQKVPIYTSSESVAMRGKGQSESFMARPADASMSMTSQPAMHTMGLQDPNATISAYTSQQSMSQASMTAGMGSGANMGMGMGMQRPMGMPRPAGAIPMPANPMQRMQQPPATQQMAPAAQPAAPIQQLQMLTPQQMMAMSPEQLQAYQQQMIAQQQQMLAMMQQQQQQQQQPQAVMPMQTQSYQPPGSAPFPSTMPAQPVHQPTQQIQPQMQPQAPAQTNNIADLMSFF